MFCTKCGEKMMASDQFCSKCGTQKLDGMPQGRLGEKDQSTHRPLTGDLDFSMWWGNRSPKYKASAIFLGVLFMIFLGLFIPSSEKDSGQTSTSPQQPAPSQVVSAPTSPVVEDEKGSLQKWIGKEREAVSLVRADHLDGIPGGGSIGEFYGRMIRVCPSIGMTCEQKWAATHEQGSLYRVQLSLHKTDQNGNADAGKLFIFHADVESGKVVYDDAGDN